MLHQGGIRFLNMAEKSLRAADHARVNEHLIRTQDIIDEIRCSFPEPEDDDAELASNLQHLYEYMGRSLVIANVRKDAGRIVEARDMLRDLCVTWQQAADMARSGGETSDSYDVTG